jgi:RNA polymerase sigma factor (sigma-70 family)
MSDHRADVFTLSNKTGEKVRQPTFVTGSNSSEEDTLKPSNEALVRACRANDPLAWEALIARFQRLVYSIPIRAGLDQDRAAEVFQHVFEQLLTHLDQIEKPEQLGAWLATTARRETWRLYRREAGAQSLPLVADDDFGAEIDQLPCRTPLPDEVLLQLEEQNRIRLAIDALDERCCSLLTMLFYRPDPPSYTEIAITLRMAEGSIGPTRARCLQKLRYLLDSM